MSFRLPTEREDVGTEPRKPLSPKKRLAIFEMRKGKCCICTLPIIGKKWIDEHGRALGLGGTNDDGNRYVAHIACAAIKTRGEDMPRIAKAKAQKRAALGLKPEGRRKIAQRPSPAKPVRDKLPIPPRRNILTGKVIAR